MLTAWDAKLGTDHRTQKRALPLWEGYDLDFCWWRGLDLNQRPLGYETDTVRPTGYNQ